MLQALCASLADAQALFDRVQSEIEVSDNEQKHRADVLTNWCLVLEAARKLSAEQLAALLEKADGDEFIEFGLPIPYAKYADTWRAFERRPVLVLRWNQMYREKYKDLIANKEMTVEDGIFLFDDHFGEFLNAEYEYSYDMFRKHVKKRKELSKMRGDDSWNTATR